MKSITEIVPAFITILGYCYIVDIYDFHNQQDDQILPITIYWPMVLLYSVTVIATHGLAHSVCLITLFIAENGFSNSYTQLILTVLSGCIFLTAIIVCNFFIPLARMHYIYQLLGIISPIRYMFEALLVLIYDFGRCGKHEIQPVLYEMSIGDNSDGSYFYHAILILILNIIFYHTVAIILLIKRVNPVENRRKKINQILTFHNQIS